MAMPHLTLLETGFEATATDAADPLTCGCFLGQAVIHGQAGRWARREDLRPQVCELVLLFLKLLLMELTLSASQPGVVL